MEQKQDGKLPEEDDFVTHREAWRDALLLVLDDGCLVGVDVDDGPLDWDIQVREFDQAFAAYAPASIPDGFRSNHEAWRLALTIARDRAMHRFWYENDKDDKAYWEHELHAFDRAFESVGIHIADGKAPEKGMPLVGEVDPRPVVPLDPDRPLFDDAGREYQAVSSSSKQIVTNSNGVFGVWDRRTGECLIINCEGVRLSNERPTGEWIARRRDAAIDVLSSMHADAAIDRARKRS
ncbi:hypothetical protein ACN8ZM_39820 (plasmid) [Burkholderia aenigmatica]|uniref:hypothetical protein n=1 Tax=Burkholderia aenigmatica TaxID=2015348 RepID=UPI003B429D74